MSDFWKRDRGGPLCDAADAFVSWQGGAPEPGVSAANWLAEKLDEFAHNTGAGDDDDERFVEGGGAFLGMLLVDFMDGVHAQKGTEHRVLLGSFGCFDPFGAIDCALDADDPPEELRRQLRLAEEEREGTGAKARVVRAFSEALKGCDRVLRDRFDLQVTTNDGIEIDLTRASISAAQEGAVSLREAVEKLVSMLPGAGGTKALEWEEAAPRLLPRLVSDAFVEELAAKHNSTPLWSQAIGGNVQVCLQLRYDDRARFLRSDEFDALAREGDPMGQAMANLARASGNAKFTAVDIGPEVGEDETVVVMAQTGDGLDSSRLLLPGLLDVLRDELGDSIVVAVPHRDTLLAAPDTELGRRVLRKKADDLLRRAPHAISTDLFRLGSRIILVD